MKTTKEAAGGFRFTVVASHTETYRAVVDDEPGYYQYGYSNAVTLVALP